MSNKGLGRRRGLRLALRLALAVLVLAALTYGLDRLARKGAQALVASAIRTDRQLSAGPDVTIEGAFFLPQVVRGTYGHVAVSLGGLRDGPLRIDQLSADLYGVRLPVGNVLRQQVRPIPVDHSRERAVLTYRDLDHYLAASGQPLTISAGEHGNLRISAHLRVLGKPFAVSADARVRAVPGYLEVSPTHLDTGVNQLDQLSSLVASRLDFRIPTAPLPFGQQVQSIRPMPEGLVVLATGDHVVIRR